MALNPNIKLFNGRFYNTKASEEYVHVKFTYPDIKSVWDGWIPVEYRRTGVSIPESDKKALAKSPTTSSTGGLILALQRAILLLAPQGGVTSTFTGPL